MHWVELDGLQVPKRVGGHPALDFCNTWAGWGEPPHPGQEWLATYDHFAVWTMHAELVLPDDVRRLRRSASRQSHEARVVLSAARQLRTAAHTAALDPTDSRAMASITGHLRRAGSVARVESGTNPRWSFPTSAGLQLPLLATAWAVGELLTSGLLDRVRACPGSDCGWLFVDTSGRRRWCSMSSCGNRAKVKAFAERRRKDSSSDPGV